MDNLDFTDEIEKIRERTFNAEFKDLVFRVINKPKETPDSPDSLLFNLHELYYTVLSCSFNDSIGFINQQTYVDTTLTSLSNELIKGCKELGFIETVVFQYDFKQNCFFNINDSFKDNLFKDFFITLSDDMYKNIMNSANGVIINIKSIVDNETYSKRLKLYDDQDFLIWVFSTHHFVKEIISFIKIPMPSFIEMFCPILFVKVRDKFTITPQLIEEFYQNCIYTVFLMVEMSIAMNKSSLFLGSNYFHEIFKVFENFYILSKFHTYAKYVVLKSKYEDESIYCLFRYLSKKIQTMQSYACINYRPMIGLIVLFIYEENTHIEMEINSIATLFNDYVKVGLVDNTTIKNAVSLYSYIVNL